jgi:hypothetical protein
MLHTTIDCTDDMKDHPDRKPFCDSVRPAVLQTGPAQPRIAAGSTGSFAAQRQARSSQALQDRSIA